MLTIRGKTLGRKQSLFAEFSIEPPPELSEGDGTTLRSLIEHVVRQEVAAFQKRQRDRQALRALTSRQILEGVERGKVDAGGSEIEPQQIDPQSAVAAALTAFEDGLYLVSIDDQAQRNLDQQVFLQPDSRVTFIRLSLLAGG